MCIPLHLFSELNLQDQHGNTPLHLAVCAGHTKCIDYLLNSGADSSVLNEELAAPIHLAVELNAIDSLKVRN